LLCLALVVVTLAAYGRVVANDFVDYDDPQYVTANAHIKAGLTRNSLRWDLTSTEALNWHPLTWMSLQLDHQLFGVRPWGYHLTNLFLHAANSLLLFLVLRRLTGAVWRSVLVAALFALHPLHVESVAWVAERKDVLSGLFWMLTLWAYVGYVQPPGLARYLVVLLTLAAGLMAKPMLVTLPAVLLLLDYWPLGRWRFAPQPGPVDRVGGPVSAGRLLVEKVPLVALCVASAIITLVAQHEGGAVMTLEDTPFTDRAGNAVVSYVRYLGMALWPSGLAPFYPYTHDSLVLGQVLAAAALLICLTALAVLARRRCPYLFVGWLWYLGTLLPVIGLVQVGEQALADRYTYLPLIGPFLAVVWGLADLASKRPGVRHALSAVAVGTLVACFAFTWVQTGHWRDSRTLWEHTLRVTRDNHVAENNLGATLREQDDLAEAEKHLREAIRIRPDFVRAWNNLGIALDQQGRIDEAIVCYQRSLELAPEQVSTQNNLGICLGKQGKLEEAVSHLTEAVRLDPTFAEAHHRLAFALARQQHLDEALAAAQQSVRLAPRNTAYRMLLASLLRKHGDYDAAEVQLREVERLSGRR
jgi:Flp pilus assembly protein TadD